LNDIIRRGFFESLSLKLRELFKKCSALTNKIKWNYLVIHKIDRIVIQLKIIINSLQEEIIENNITDNNKNNM